MGEQQPKTVCFFYRDDLEDQSWVAKAEAHIKATYPDVLWCDAHDEADTVVVFGGDGTILDAVRQHKQHDTLFFGLNLGSLGFLASVREEKAFLAGLDTLFSGKYQTVRRSLVQATIVREGDEVCSVESLNDVVIQNMLGVLEMDVAIDGEMFQQVRGSGLLVATATGSTAFNLSAHGPILMPQVDSLIVTELLDHHIPTPSVVLEPEHTITVTVTDFREHDTLTLTKTGETVDVALVAGGHDNVFVVKKDDVITIKKSERSVRFAEVDDHYFLKSMREKFGFK